MASPIYRLDLESLTDRINPTAIYATASPNSSLVVITDAATGSVVRTIQAFDPSFTGGVSLAQGDINRDGTPEVIVGAGPGAGPHVKVFDGETGQVLLSFFAFDLTFTGGVRVAAGDVTNDAHADIIVGAGAGGAPHVKVFDGVSGAVLYSFYAFDAAFTGGVNVAAGDFKPDGHADIVAAAGAGGGPAVSIFDGTNGAVLTRFYAFDEAFTGGVNVAASDLTGRGQADLIVGAGTGGGPRVRVFHDAGLTVAADFYAGDASDREGALVGATDSSGDDLDEILASDGGAVSFYDFESLQQLRTTPGRVTALTGGVSRGAGTEPAKNNLVDAEIPVVERLGQFNGTSFLPVDLSNLPANTNLYVAVHGWAPGYLDWVNDYQARTGQVLKWWQTNPADVNYDGQDNPDDLIPAGNFMFQSNPFPVNPLKVTVSTLGLAAAVTSIDSNAVVLAYSWIDNSATKNALFNEIPHDANLSEAHTDLNGLRLAEALQQVLPSNFFTNGGQLHILGHSHGSKVATVATLALENAGVQVDQLTVLDSPEVGTITNLAQAVNFNWYYLQNVAISRTPADGGTFVDNYISEFNTRYSNIGLPNLSKIVDVTLDPILYSELNFSERHSYAPTWYVGTSQVSGNGGLAFSPLLNPPPVTPLAAAYSQAWQKLPQDLSKQYTLNVAEAFPPTATVQPTFTAVDFLADASTGTVTSNLATDTVTMSDTSGQSTWTGYYKQAAGTAGLTFDYQFTSPGSTDQISISVNGDLLFVVNGAAAGPRLHTATLSYSNLTGDIFCNKYFPSETCSAVTVALTPSGATGTATVVLSNFRQIAI